MKYKLVILLLYISRSQKYDLIIKFSKKARLKSYSLTQRKLCFRPVAVQFGSQFFILEIHIKSFSVEMYGIDEILLSVLLITLIVVNLCYC